MKHYLFSFFVILFASCHSQQQPKLAPKERTLPRLTFTAKVLRTFYNLNQKPFNCTLFLDTLRDENFEMELSLKNNTESIISFWIMSCSQEDNLILNNKDFKIFFEGCDKNLPQIKALKPNDSFVLTIILLRNLPADSLIDDSLWVNRKMHKTKIGFVFADASTLKEEHDYGNFMKDKSRWKDIIWSNGLSLEAAQ